MALITKALGSVLSTTNTHTQRHTHRRTYNCHDLSTQNCDGHHRTRWGEAKKQSKEGSRPFTPCPGAAENVFIHSLSFNKQ